MNRRRKILITIGVVIIVALLAPVIRHYQLRAVTNDYIAELKAKGEPMDLAQVIPPSVPPDQNSADAFRKAAGLFAADQSLFSSNMYFSMRMVAPGKAMACSQQPDARDSNATNSWEEVAAAVAQNKETFELLHTIVEKPAFDFGINYADGVVDLNFTNLYLSELKHAALRLQVSSLSELHHGDGASAVRDVRTMLAIAKAMREERLVISELVRIAIVQIAWSDNWEILQSPNVTDEQLAKLQDDWAGLEFFHAQENALGMECVSGEITAQKMRKSNAKLRHYFLLDDPKVPWADWPEPSAIDRLRLTSRTVRWQYFWFYPDELRTLKGYQVLLEAPRAAQMDHSLLAVQNRLESEIAKLSIPTNADEYYGLSDPMKADLHFFLSASILSLNKAFSRIIKVETAKQMAVAGIALKRYHLKHRQYPDALAELAPEFLSEVPRDPIDGQSLRYKLNSDGTFLLYSVGDDGKDDGGDSNPVNASKSFQWQATRDWVWPQPATAEEIQKFHDNPPK